MGQVPGDQSTSLGRVPFAHDLLLKLRTKPWGFQTGLYSRYRTLVTLTFQTRWSK